MKLLRISDKDNVAVALDDIKEGENLSVSDISVTALDDIQRGHKIALSDIKAGENIIKYGFPIASAKEEIKAGKWVHTHNAKTNLSEESDYTYDHKTYPAIGTKKRTFEGFVREDGRAAVRNDIWIIPLVGCVNSVAEKMVKDNQDLVKGTVTGLYTFPHPFGCSQMGDDLATTKRVLTGLVAHPNAGAVLVLALGCENLTLSMFQEALGSWNSDRVKFLVCQESGTSLKTAENFFQSFLPMRRSLNERPSPPRSLSSE